MRQISLCLALTLSLLACKSRVTSTPSASLTPTTQTSGKSAGGLDLAGDYDYLQSTLAEYKASSAYKKPSNEQDKTLKTLADIVSKLDPEKIQSQIVDKGMCQQINKNVALFYPRASTGLNLSDSSDTEGIPPYIKDPRLNSSGIALLVTSAAALGITGYAIYNSNQGKKFNTASGLAPIVGGAALALLYGSLLLTEHPSDQTIQMAQTIGIGTGVASILTGLAIVGGVIQIDQKEWKVLSANTSGDATKQGAGRGRADSDPTHVPPSAPSAPSEAAEGRELTETGRSVDAVTGGTGDAGVRAAPEAKAKAQPHHFIAGGLVAAGIASIIVATIPKMGSWDPGTSSGGAPLGQQLTDSSDPLPSEPRARFLLRMEVFLQDACTLPRSR